MRQSGADRGNIATGKDQERQCKQAGGAMKISSTDEFTVDRARPETLLQSAAQRRFFVLLLLLAHPMMSEVALNITARTDLLAALFGLLALLMDRADCPTGYVVRIH